jgi:glyoxylase-like metal-dependent hydrolase (beta-lactamase superfamily II)
MTMNVERRIGDLTVVAVSDAESVYDRPLREIFTGVDPEQWRAAARIDPASGDGTGDSPWRLGFRSFAIRADDGVLLVDAGVGPVSDWSLSPGRLPERLAEAGIEVGDVTAVLLTHLHTDHIGWAAVDGRPFFPNAEYVLQRAEFAAVREHYPWLAETLIGPLTERDRLRLVDGRAAVHPAVTAVPTPGHTPGHQSFLVASGGAEVLLTGDVVQHAVQLLNPAAGYVHDADPVTAEATRRELLARGGVFGAAHLGTAFVDVPPRRS